jgi:cell division protein FtsZ
MTINISIPDVGPNLHPQITVLGVGGSGGNAVNNMINSNLEGVDFLIANTDAQALQISNCNKKIQLGIQSTRGLGAGMRPDIGKLAAEETLNEISEMLEGSHMLFIAAGMGGGTGTGAAPVIAKLAREKGILTVGVVTKPFHFEGSQRMKLADEGINELQQYVDTLLIIPNQNLFRIANEKTTFADAFKMADDVLYAGVRGVTDLMVQPGLINLDFSDVKTVMSEMGKAMMGTGEASGEGRAIAAAEAAIANPLIDDVSLKGAKGLIINITGGNDITLYEVDEAANRIKQEVDETANIIYGTTCDERLEGLVRVSLVATGIDVSSAVQPKPLENFSSLAIDNSVYQQKSSQLNVTSLAEENIVNEEENIVNEEENIVNEEENIVNKEENIVSEEENIVNEEDHKINLDIENPERGIQDKVNTNESNNLFDTDSLSLQDSRKEISLDSSSLSNSMKELDVDTDRIENIDLTKEVPNNDVKSSVRKLSLFDTLESQEVEMNKSILSQDKTEPVFEKYQENQEKSDDFIDEDVALGEFSAEVSEDGDFNQEPEEELLDIPTFLRRQAN